MPPKLGYIDPITKKPIVNCINYAECPICYKCDNNGVFVKCHRCIAGGGNGNRCRHDHKMRSFAIRRENFRIKVRGEEWVQAFKNAEAQLDQLKERRG